MTFCEYTDFLDSFGDFDEKKSGNGIPDTQQEGSGENTPIQTLIT